MARRSRQRWSIIGWSGVAQESANATVSSASERLGEFHHRLHAGGEPRQAFVIGDLPAPRAAGAAEGHDAGDRPRSQQEPCDVPACPCRASASTAVSAKRRNSGSWVSAVPAAPFQPFASSARKSCSAAATAAGLLRHLECDRPGFGEAAAQTLEFLVALFSDGAFDVMRGVAVRPQSRAPMPAERRQGTTFDCGAQRLHDRPGIVEQRQQEKLRQRCIGGDMIEERRHHGGDGVAIDQRRPQRRERMRPAVQHRELHAIATCRHPEREQADEAPRHVGGPHQDRLDVAAEHGRGGEREARLVEHVWLDGMGAKPPPWLDDVAERRKRAPFREQGLRGGQHVTASPGRPR